MTDRESDGRTILENELIFGVRRRERLAWVVAIGGVLVGFGGVAVAGLMLPLKETQAFVTIVDKDTGLAERAVRVEAAGIEHGAHMAMYFADEAVVVTNPEVSSVRDSDRVLGLLSSQTKRAETQGAEPIKAQVLITRYDQERVDRGEMMTVDDVLEILAVPLLGVVPESKAILKASNVGTPVTLDGPSAASQAYNDAVSRLTGTQVEMRIQGERRPGLFQRLFGRAS